MGASNLFETRFLKLVLQNKQFANIGTTQGIPPSTANGSVYVSLHTADPADSTSQTTNEVSTGSYQNYARQAIARTTSAWTVSGNNAYNTTALAFPACGAAGSTSVTHFGIGDSSSNSTGLLFFSGALSSTLAVSNGITPQFAAGDLDVYCS